MDFEQILNMLFQFIGGSGQGYKRSPYEGGMPFHSSNAFSSSSGFIENALKALIPGMNMKQQAPWFTLQHDFDTMLRRSSDLETMSSLYTYQQHGTEMPGGAGGLSYFNTDQRMLDMSRKLMTTMGVSAKTQGEFMANPWVNTAMGMVGPALLGQSPGARQMNIMSDMSRYFAAQPMTSSQGGFNVGMPMEAVRDISTKLFQSTYKDKYGLMKKSSFFEVEDMADIMRLGLDTGMEMPTTKEGNIDTDQLIRNTKNLSKVIQAGMSIFQTMDKEQVLQNIMEMTRGKINIGDTASLENIIYKVNAVAKSINVNTKFMQKISAEGAALFEQLGLEPQTGAVMAAELTARSKRFTSGPGKLFSAEETAQLGGATEIRKSYFGSLAEMLTSPLYRSRGLAFGAKNAGLITDEEFSQVDKQYDKNMLPEFVEGGLTISLRRKMIDAEEAKLRAKGLKLSDETLREMAAAKVDQIGKEGMKYLQEGMQSGKISSLDEMKRFSANKVRDAFENPEAADIALDNIENKDYQDAIKTKLYNMFRKQGVDEVEARRQTELNFKVLNMTPEQRTEELKAIELTIREAATARAAQANFIPKSILDPLKRYFTGGTQDTFLEAFGKTYKGELLNLSTSAEVYGVESKEYKDRLKRFMDPKNLDKLKEVMREWYEPDNQALQNVFTISSQITGVTQFKREDARRVFESSQVKEKVKGENWEKFRKSIKDINPDELKKQMVEGNYSLAAYSTYLQRLTGSDKYSIDEMMKNPELLQSYFSYVGMNDKDAEAKTIMGQVESLKQMFDLQRTISPDKKTVLEQPVDTKWNNVFNSLWEKWRTGDKDTKYTPEEELFRKRFPQINEVEKALKAMGEDAATSQKGQSEFIAGYLGETLITQRKTRFENIEKIKKDTERSPERLKEFKELATMFDSQTMIKSLFDIGMAKDKDQEVAAKGIKVLQEAFDPDVKKIREEYDVKIREAAKIGDETLIKKLEDEEMEKVKDVRLKQKDFMQKLPKAFELFASLDPNEIARMVVPEDAENRPDVIKDVATQLTEYQKTIEGMKKEVSKVPDQDQKIAAEDQKLAANVNKEASDINLKAANISLKAAETLAGVNKPVGPGAKVNAAYHQLDKDVTG